MALNDIALSSSMRQNLISLQGTAQLMARTSERLATGKRVNSALDDPSAYFAAMGHTSRASELSTRKAYMSEAMQTVTAANSGVDAITSLIEQAKGLAASARSSADSTERSALAAQFDELLTQIDELANDSGYRGTNLLDSDTLTVAFNEDGSSSLTITGFDASSSGLSIAGAASDWADNSDIDTATADLDAATSTLRSQAKTLASNLDVVTTRQTFTAEMINALQTGADNLTLADTNEESANLLALQVRQQLAISALSISAQAEQSILQLL
jgi:flagellin